MMASLNKIVVDLIALNGGSIVGKTRLQKTVYLLEQCGVRAGMDFDYHYYGPYSQEVTQAARWTELEGALSEQEYVTSSGDPYSVFTTRNKAGAYVGELSADQAAEDLNILKSYNSAELELAATIHYLYHHGYADAAIEETRARKPSKASAYRIQRASELLKKLGLKLDAAVANDLSEQPA